MARWRVRLALVSALALVVAAPVSAAGAVGLRFVTPLAGSGEIPMNDSMGRGVATFKLSDDGQSLTFKLNASNIVGVTQSHIHCGIPGSNGPVVVFLYGFNAAGTDPHGRLSEGTLTAANLIPRASSAACPGGIATWADLIAKMQSGNTYVNVHTLALPAGEIRGQLICNLGDDE